jgi:DNA-binding MarR family transcriptional regulator
MEVTRQTHQSGLRQHAVLAWLRLARVFQIDMHSERFFRAHSLNTAQFDVLAQVGAAHSMTQQELADALLVTKGNISQLLGKLDHGILA